MDSKKHNAKPPAPQVPRTITLPSYSTTAALSTEAIIDGCVQIARGYNILESVFADDGATARAVFASFDNPDVLDTLKELLDIPTLGGLLQEALHSDVWAKYPKTTNETSQGVDDMMDIDTNYNKAKRLLPDPTTPGPLTAGKSTSTSGMSPVAIFKARQAEKAAAEKKSSGIN